MICIDIEARFPKYKIGYDDPFFRATKDPWNKTIIGSSGTISPHTETTLLVCTNSNRSKLAVSIRSGELPCKITQDGDDGVNAEFDVDDVEIFLNAIKAKRK